MLQEIWDEQGGRCAITGEPLIPGANASIDHILPKSKGGDESRDNLRWVLHAANTAKSDLSHNEFIDLCRKVVAHADKLSFTNT